MSSKVASQDGFEPVLVALATMQSNGSKQEKSQAHEFLEQFQKSSEAWNTTHTILHSPESSVEAKLFAATTLKGKITYDLHQLPEQALNPLRDSVISLLQTYSAGPRPIRTQLCVCLASLAIQLTSWKNVMVTIGPAISSSPDGQDAILDFLRILPEEVTEGRKINLTEEELHQRTEELLGQNTKSVLNLLVSYSQSSASAAINPRLYECITSWLREIPAVDVVNSPLLDKIIAAINNEASFDSAVDCLCAIYRDTRDVDQNISLIEVLYPRILQLRPKIKEAADTEDSDLMKGVTRIFAEAGEAWVVLIARMPDQFRGLVEATLECCMRDHDRDAISITFIFWYELKQYITLEKYIQARATLADLYSKLVDIMIKHLQFPSGVNDDDLFDGDKEQEEKFREFRHAMGDVLKDCCEVIGVTQCLGKAVELIEQWAQKHGGQVASQVVPHWQELEAPLFSLRAMGRMVSPEESTVLPRVIPVIVTIPDHEKLKFQAIMALGRYTEWTAEHPETLEAQLNYVISGFNHSSAEVVQASALAFRFLGNDCAKLLGQHVSHLHTFYESVIDKLKASSQEEVTEGVAAVVGVQPVTQIYQSMKLFCDPLMARIMSLAQRAQDEDSQKKVADYVQLVTIFIQYVQPYVGPEAQNPAVKYCKEILPALAALTTNFPKSTPILERVCRCWRHMMISYRTAMGPLLPELAPAIANGFQASKQGCFLWATDAVLREFTDGAEFVDKETSESVYSFFASQAVVFLRILNELPPYDLPDVIEDFFRLSTDAVRYYPQKTILSPLAEPMVQASLTALTLQSMDPLISTLQFLRDFLGFGFDSPPVSEENGPNGEHFVNPAEVQGAVKRIILANGKPLIERVLTGMLFSFPEDVFPDASAILLSLFTLTPQQAAQWIQGTLQLLPAGTLKPTEANKLMNGISDKIQQNEPRKVKILLQDFTNSYRRRNVAPREGLRETRGNEVQIQWLSKSWLSASDLQHSPSHHHGPHKEVLLRQQSIARFSDQKGQRRQGGGD